MRRMVLALLSAIAMAPMARADLVGDVNSLRAWTRHAGSYSDVETPEGMRFTALDPYRVGKAVRLKKIYDQQYHDKRHYRGVPLLALVDSYAAGKKSDLVILHFENGMQVPLTRTALKRVAAFVAVEACDGRGKACRTEFETVERSAVYGEGRDPRPITFTWNKLVVESPWFPERPASNTGEFSPWLYVDSLVGLEFAEERAYFAQFAVGKSGGDKVFRARCQYCHAARLVGARFGWDFVIPLALAEKRSPESLTLHVKYQKTMAPTLGIQMPPQKDVEPREMRRLWEWMRDVAARPLPPYTPKSKGSP